MSIKDMDSRLRPDGRMDRHLWQEHLIQADRAVSEGERHIARVRQIIAELERDGQDAEQARSLLDTFVALQVQHVAHRDRLIEELGVADDELARPNSAH